MFELDARYDACVCLTFDVDADTGWEWRGFESKLSSRSEASFGIRRGLPRVLDLLERRSIRATFYVPGDVLERHGDAIGEIVARGHCVGHHGYAHLRSDAISAEDQEEEIVRALEVMKTELGIVPHGYRSPAWELTPATLKLIVEAGFAYDSSCMGDDAPYVEREGPHSILELPVHWSLDDYIFFGFGVEARSPDATPWHRTWLAELEHARQERGVVTLTMHPEIIGRRYRMRALDALLDELTTASRVRFATHDELAQACKAGAALGPP